MVDTIVFVIAALLVLAPALMVVATRHPIHAALYLVLSFMGLALLFLQLQAPFLAAVQIIVYAGAIMVLFLFVIMLLGEDKPMCGERELKIALPMIALLIAMLGAGYFMAQSSAVAPPAPADVVVMGGPQTAKYGSVMALGNTLFSHYVFAFEATSIVLLIAMVGVVVLAKKRL